MLYLISNPIHSDLRYFFANPTLQVAAAEWAYDIPAAVSKYKDALTNHYGKSHSVYSWINVGFPNHAGYALEAIFESDDLTQDFEAGITNFRENHPEYFL